MLMMLLLMLMLMQLSATANDNAHKHGKNKQLVQHQRCAEILEILHQQIESIFIRLQPVGYSDGFSNGYNFSGRTDVGKKKSPKCNHNMLIHNDMASGGSNSCPFLRALDVGDNSDVGFIALVANTVDAVSSSSASSSQRPTTAGSHIDAAYSLRTQYKNKLSIQGAYCSYYQQMMYATYVFDPRYMLSINDLWFKDIDRYT